MKEKYYVVFRGNGYGSFETLDEAKIYLKKKRTEREKYYYAGYIHKGIAIVKDKRLMWGSNLRPVWN